MRLEDEEEAFRPGFGVCGFDKSSLVASAAAVAPGGAPTAGKEGEEEAAVVSPAAFRAERVRVEIGLVALAGSFKVAVVRGGAPTELGRSLWNSNGINGACGADTKSRDGQSLKIKQISLPNES